MARAVLAVSLVVAGALLIWLAEAGASGRLRRNTIAGLRTRSTLASDAGWLAAHVRTKRHTLAAGSLLVAGGLVALLPVPMPVVVTVVLVVTGGVLALVARAAVVGSRAAREADPDD